MGDTIFDRIKYYAKLRGYSLQKTAELSGLSKNAIYQYNRGKMPSIETLSAIANTLQVPPFALLNDIDHPEIKKIRNAMVHGGKLPDIKLEDVQPIADDNMPVDLEEVLDKLGPTLRFEGKELTDEQKIKLYEMAKLMFGE